MVTVQKADGSAESFDEGKVLSSIRRAGIPKELEHEVLSHVKSRIYEGIETWEIYHHIQEFLGKSSHPYTKSRYSLKQAIMLLGPTGYPFEDFIADVLKAEGYSVEVRQILLGQCVSHEVDVIAKKENETLMVEAKFHNNPGNRSDLHVSLYTKARFDDLKEKYKLTKGMLATNTKLTTEAIAYAACQNVRVFGWSYPVGESLRDLIEKHTLFPVTVLSSLTMRQKATLLANHIVLCKEICEKPELLTTLSLSKEEKQQTLDEVGFVCQS